MKTIAVAMEGKVSACAESDESQTIEMDKGKKVKSYTYVQNCSIGEGVLHLRTTSSERAGQPNCMIALKINDCGNSIRLSRKQGMLSYVNTYQTPGGLKSAVMNFCITHGSELKIRFERFGHSKWIDVFFNPNTDMIHFTFDGKETTIPRPKSLWESFTGFCKNVFRRI